MSISVVVPIYITNQAQYAMTIKCLELAKKTKLPYELIIVESSSKMFSSYPCDVYIHEKDAVSSTRSMNRAFSCASGEYTALLTNDVYVSDGWLEELLKPFETRYDCGISTLASTQFGHVKSEEIEEDGIWFSVAMWRTAGKVFDERFRNVWDDTDFTMRVYLSGHKSYRNHACVVEHLVGKTQYVRRDHQENFINGKKLFIEKYSDCNHPMFTKLAGI